MLKTEGKNKEIGKRTQRKRKTEPHIKGNNAIKSKPSFMKIKELSKEAGGEDLNELKTQIPCATNIQLIREKTMIKQTKISSRFSSLDKQNRRLDISKKTQSEHQR